MNQNKTDEDIDLSGMLKNSRPSAEFDEYKNTKNTRPHYDEDADDSKMVQMAIKHSGGLIKDGKQASFVLLGVAVLAVIISLVLLFGGGHTQQTPTVKMLEKMKQMPVNTANR